MQAQNEDFLLIQDTLKGDQAAFARLIDKYKNLVFGISLRMLGNHTEAEDTAQEVFIQAYSHLGKLKINEKFYSWLYTITVNTCRNKMKKFSRTKTVELTEAMEAGGESAHTENLERDVIAKHDNEKKAAQILRLLPDKYRVPFFLRYMEDRSYDEIATITKLPLGTVKTYIHRALDIIISKKQELGYK